MPGFDLPWRANQPVCAHGSRECTISMSSPPSAQLRTGAGTHTPRPCFLARWLTPSAPTDEGGYGSPRARGRRLVSRPLAARLTRLLRARSGSASSAAAKVFPIPAFSFQGSDSLPGVILAKQRPKFPSALREPLVKPLLKEDPSDRQGLAL